MDATRIVRTYKDLGHVERAFRNLKTVQLEIRPVYHHKDDRIRAHVFLCVLAYYVQWHIRQRLEPLFAEDGPGRERRWPFENFIQRLNQIGKHMVRMDARDAKLCLAHGDVQPTLLNSTRSSNGSPNCSR